MTDEQLHALKREFDEVVALRDNLKATQERCSQLLNESRRQAKVIKQLEARWNAMLTGQLELEPVPDLGSSGESSAG